MENGIHFISGLPRSGSTLLSAILRQNPRFHAGMSSPMSQLIGQLQLSLSTRNEMHVFMDETIRRNVMRGAFEGYYADVSETKLVFDTGRPWCSKIHLLHELFPEARIICCVRHILGILDSIERIVRGNPLVISKMFSADSGATVYSRVETVRGPKGMVGGPMNGLAEAFYGEHASKLILVPYETLVAEPEYTLAQIYDFIGEPRFSHDFEDVQYEADDFDLHIGAPGLHKVSGRVEPRKRASVLPPDVVLHHGFPSFWLDPAKNPRNVRVLLPAQSIEAKSPELAALEPAPAE